MQSQPATPKTIEQMRGGFLRAMSDAGLKPTVVFHNLTPAELYEKVKAFCFLQAVSLHAESCTRFGLVLPLCVHHKDQSLADVGCFTQPGKAFIDSSA